MEYILLGVIAVLLFIGTLGAITIKDLDKEIDELKDIIKKKDKKHNDKLDMATNQYFNYDGVIESLGVELEKSEKEVSELKADKTKVKQKLWYTRKRIISLETELVEVTNNPRRNSGRKFTD